MRRRDDVVCLVRDRRDDSIPPDRDEPVLLRCPSPAGVLTAMVCLEATCALQAACLFLMWPGPREGNALRSIVARIFASRACRSYSSRLRPIEGTAEWRTSSPRRRTTPGVLVRIKFSLARSSAVRGSPREEVEFAGRQLPSRQRSSGVATGSVDSSAVGLLARESDPYVVRKGPDE